MKKIIIGVIAVIIAAVAAFAIVTVTSPKYKLEIKDNNIEATQEVNLNKLVAVKEKYKDQYTVSVKGEAVRTFPNPSDEVITYVLEGKGETKNVDIKFSVVDTTPPDIKVLKNFLQTGDTFDLKDFIEVSDTVDGKMDSRDASSEGEINTNKSGTYTIEVAISDSSGNEASEAFDVTVADKAGFIKQIGGLWLNKCLSKDQAYSTAHFTGLTDVGMTQFDVHNGEVYMTTLGDIEGNFDGDPLPFISGSQIEFTYISDDNKSATGIVAEKKIEFDLSNIDNGLFSYTCDGKSTQCGFTGFQTMAEMDSYLWEQNGF